MKKYYSVTQLLSYSVTQSLSHSVTQSLSHSVTQSLSHSVTQSLSHLFRSVLTVAVVALCIACEKIPDEDKLNPDTTFVSAEPDSLNFSYDGGELPVVISSSGTWTLSGNASWCSPSIKSGEDGSTVIFKATAISKNETKERSTSYTLSCGDASTKIIITQSPRPEFYVSAEPDSLNFKNLGGERSLVVSSSGTWELSGECDWCTPSVRSGDNGEAIIFTAKAISNTATEDRNTSFTLSCGDATAKITITQLTYQNSYYVSTEPDSLTFKPSGGEFSVKVSSSDTWELSGECDWCTPSAKNGIDGDPITFTALPQSETATEDRSTTFILKCGHATAEIAITQTRSFIKFNDQHFLDAILAQNSEVDINGDRQISVEEAKACTVLNISGSYLTLGKISDMTEIKYFTNIKELSCSFNQLSQLDVSNNTKLEWLDCSFNQLSQLDVSNNTLLKILYCYDNQLSQLDVSNNTKLEWLNCYGNQLSQLDVSNNTLLTNLQCSGNQLSQLDVSNNTKLERLDCNGNQLLQLDVSNSTLLKILQCNDNQLSQLDVSNNTKLEWLDCSGNQLLQLDVSNNTLLKILSCHFNQLSQLNVSNNTLLTNLECSGNQLSQLDVSNNTKLEWLDCYDNQLSQLDVSNNTLLTNLHCHDNQLSQLDVSNNTKLEWLGCSGNQLSQLDVSNNTLLKILQCYDNQLSQLDVSNNTLLTTLWCYDNQLSQLDVSNNTKLEDLRCHNNPLKKLILAKYADWYNDIVEEYPDLVIIFSE